MATEIGKSCSSQCWVNWHWQSNYVIATVFAILSFLSELKHIISVGHLGQVIGMLRNSPWSLNILAL